MRTFSVGVEEVKFVNRKLAGIFLAWSKVSRTIIEMANGAASLRPGICNRVLVDRKASADVPSFRRKSALLGSSDPVALDRRIFTLRGNMMVQKSSSIDLGFIHKF